MDNRISKENKSLFYAVAFSLTFILGMVGIDESLLLDFVVVGLDLAALGCIISSIFHIFCKRFSDWAIITVFVGILTLILGIQGVYRLMFGKGDIFLEGVVRLILAVPPFTTTVICAICWHVYFKRQ